MIFDPTGFRLKFLQQLQESAKNSCNQERSKDIEDVSICSIKSETKKLKVRNPYVRISLKHPNLFNHVCNFYNMFGINEKTLKDPSNQESFLRTFFYVHTIERVETRRAALIFYLKKSSNTFLPTEYYINRYKSFGDQQFFNLAQQMEELSSIFNQIALAGNKQQKQKVDPPSLFIDMMQGRAYQAVISLNKLIFSRKLLEILGYDPELVALQAIKYGSFLHDMISAENYAFINARFLSNLQKTALFLQNKITQEELIEATTMQFTDWLIGNNNKRIYCKLKLHFPMMCGCLEVIEVIHEKNELNVIKSTKQLTFKKMIDTQTKIIREQQLELLQNIYPLPKNSQPKNQYKVAGYKELNLD